MKFTTEERRMITFEKDTYPNLHKLIKKRRKFVREQMKTEVKKDESKSSSHS